MASRAGSRSIDALRGARGGLDRAALLSILPYGEDFLFVDAVSRLDEEGVEASFRIPSTASYLSAHFRELPLMPGALVIEGLGQAGTLLVRYNLEDPERKAVFGLQIERARFPAPALPGETLRYAVRLRALDSRAARIEGEARTEDRLVATARVVVGIMDFESFRERVGAEARRRTTE